MAPDERAAGDDPRGHRVGVFLGILGRLLLDGMADQRAEEEQQAVAPREGPGKADPGCRRDPLLLLGKPLRQQREDDSDEAAGKHRPRFERGKFTEPLAHHFRNGLPRHCRRRRELLRGKDRAVLHEGVETEDGHHGPDEDPGELCKELLARVRARR